MSNEVIIVIGSQTTLESSGAVIANGSVVGATTAYNLVSTGSSYPDAEFVLAATYSTAPTDGTTINLYAQPLDIDGTSDAEVPEAARPTYFVGSFVVNNVTTQQFMSVVARDIPINAKYYLHNNGTGQSVQSGWTLKVTPRTYKPAP